MERIDLAPRIGAAREANPGKVVDCYVLFEDHTDAMALYGAARGAGLPARVSTTPRQARSVCGVALLVPADAAQQIVDLACAQGLPFEDVVALPCQIDPRRDRYC